MSIDKKANEVVVRAKEIAKSGMSWSEFASVVSDPDGGIIAKAFPDPAERQVFLDTDQYKEIRALRLSLMKKQGVAAGGKSGKFVVRVPKTLHEVLDVEAKREGVSLNQLVVAKLAYPLRETADVDTNSIVKAFAAVHDGYAVDRVVVDPVLDAKFLERCRKYGLSEDELSDYQLNHALFDIRKSGKAEIPPTTKKTEYRDFDFYQYGSEIAVRMLQKAEGVSLDRILCDPKLAAEFDRISEGLVSEKMVLKRRWAALNLRKTRRLQPADLSGPTYPLVSAGPLRAVPLGKLSSMPAAYAFYDTNRPLFAGETDNLKRRIELHLASSPTSGWVNLREDTIVLKTFVAPTFTSADRQRWLRHFIDTERPILNYQKTA